MTRAEFDRKYHYVFDESIIWQYIYDKRKELAEVIIDIAAHISSKYDGDVAFRPTAYTPHDFKHHIIGVIKNADNLLINTFRDFDVEDLFCFLSSCVLHDVGMIHYPDETRNYHSFIGAKIVYEDIASPDLVPDQIYKDIIQYIEYEEEKNPISDHTPNKDLQTEIQGLFSNYSNLISDTHKYKIAVMILGHSDLKFFASNKIINTLDDKIYMNCGFSSFPSIHILAAYLRWADEIDLSERRCQGINIEQLQTESKPYWKKLKLILRADILPSTLILHINRKVYNEDVTESDKLLHELDDKLNKEKTTCNNVFLKYGKQQYLLPNTIIQQK